MLDRETKHSRCVNFFLINVFYNREADGGLYYENIKMYVKF